MNHLVPVLTPNYKQHILSPAKVRKVFYSLAEIYVKAIYLNLSPPPRKRHHGSGTALLYVSSACPDEFRYITLKSATIAFFRTHLPVPFIACHVTSRSYSLNSTF
jgi:hypothetical protein